MIQISIDLALKITVLLLFLIWKYYWYITEKVADREKPKDLQKSSKSFLRRQITTIAGLFILLQMIGFDILPMTQSLLLQILGLLLVAVGASTGIYARKTLRTNWNHAHDFQIKRNHELITNGIYSYIRHPIYTGLILAVTGTELVIGSYLFIPFFMLATLLAVKQGRQEEEILRGHFGKKYEEYMKKTKMLFPYIF